MSDLLLRALENVRPHLESGIAEAQAELAAARLRRRELRQLAATARPVQHASTLEVATPMPGGAAIEPIAVAAPESVHDAPPEPIAVAAPEPASVGSSTTTPVRRDLPMLPWRWLLALGAIRRVDLDRLPGLLARNIILRWEGENPIAGTHLGHAKALSFLRQLRPFVDGESVRVDEVHADDSNVEIVATVPLKAPSRPSVRVDTDLTVVTRFNSAGMVTLLFLTPSDPAAVDSFFHEAMAEDSRSA
jgi:hypothetical protein